MLMPKKVKYRKQQRGRMRGKAYRGGDAVVRRLWASRRSSRAGSPPGRSRRRRIAMTRHIKRGGKIWIRIFPDKPYTKKPAETRMGKGKGAPEGWVAVVKPGRILYEMEGVDVAHGKEALDARRATRSGSRRGHDHARVRDGRIAMKKKERETAGAAGRGRPRGEGEGAARGALEAAPAEVDGPAREPERGCGSMRRDIARVKTYRRALELKARGSEASRDCGKKGRAIKIGQRGLRQDEQDDRRRSGAHACSTREYTALHQADEPRSMAHDEDERGQGGRPGSHRRDAAAVEAEALVAARNPRRKARGVESHDSDGNHPRGCGQLRRPEDRVHPDAGGSAGQLRRPRRHHHGVGQGVRPGLAVRREARQARRQGRDRPHAPRTSAARTARTSGSTTTRPS